MKNLRPHPNLSQNMNLQSLYHQPHPTDSYWGGLRLGLGFCIVSSNLSGMLVLLAHRMTTLWVASRQKTPTSKAQLVPEQNEAFQCLWGRWFSLTFLSLCSVWSCALHLYPFCKKGIDLLFCLRKEVIQKPPTESLQLCVCWYLVAEQRDSLLRCVVRIHPWWTWICSAEIHLQLSARAALVNEAGAAVTPVITLFPLPTSFALWQMIL